MKFSNLILTTPYLNLKPVFYNKIDPTPLDKPFLISTSQSAAKLLGVDEDLALDEELINIINGKTKQDNDKELAQEMMGALANASIDYTEFFRKLSHFNTDKSDILDSCVHRKS